jgi:hypothetical protein
MPDERPPAVAAVMHFIDAINRGEVNRLGDLMTEDHRLAVFDEPPLDGREANVDAWRGYLSSFPRYAIYPHHITERSRRVAILGHTTGSHLGLPDEDEAKLLLIWVAVVDNGKLATWQLVRDTAEHREQLGLDPPPDAAHNCRPGAPSRSQ